MEHLAGGCQGKKASLNIEIPPTVQYHRKCRSIFNLKRILDTIISQEGNTSPQTSKQSSTSYYGRPSRDEPSTSRLYDARSIF